MANQLEPLPPQPFSATGQPTAQQPTGGPSPGVQALADLFTGLGIGFQGGQGAEEFQQQLLGRRQLAQQESQFGRGLEHERGLQTQRLDAEMQRMIADQKFREKQAALAQKFDTWRTFITSDRPEARLMGLNLAKTDKDLRESLTEAGVDPEDEARIERFARIQLDAAEGLAETNAAEAALAKLKRRAAEKRAKDIPLDTYENILLGFQKPLEGNPLHSLRLEAFEKLKKDDPQMADSVALALLGEGNEGLVAMIARAHRQRNPKASVEEAYTFALSAIASLRETADQSLANLQRLLQTAIEARQAGVDIPLKPGDLAEALSAAINAAFQKAGVQKPPKVGRVVTEKEQYEGILKAVTDALGKLGTGRAEEVAP